MNNFQLSRPDSASSPQYYEIINNAPFFTNETSFNPKNVYGTTPYIESIVFDSVHNAYYYGGDLEYDGSLAPRVLKYDVTSNVYSQLGGGLNGPGTALALDSLSTYLYVGGRFSTVTQTNGDILTVPGIAIWDITNNVWISFGVDIVMVQPSTGSPGPPYISTLTFDPILNNLYVSGDMTLATLAATPTATPTIINGIIALNVSDVTNVTFSALGMGLTYYNIYYPGNYSAFVPVVTLDSTSNSVFVSGNFEDANQSDGAKITVNGIAKWDITNSIWVALGKGLDLAAASTSCIVVDSSTQSLYIGGLYFSTVVQPNGDLFLINGIAKLNLTTYIWSSLGNGVMNPSGSHGAVQSLFLKSGLLYVAGSFSVVSNVNGAQESSYGIAIWDTTNSTWITLNGGLLYPFTSPINNSIYVRFMFMVYENLVIGSTTGNTNYFNKTFLNPFVKISNTSILNIDGKPLYLKYGSPTTNYLKYDAASDAYSQIN